MFRKMAPYLTPGVALTLLLAAPLAQASEKLEGSGRAPAVSTAEPVRSTGMLYRVRVSSLHPGWVHEVLPLEKTSHGKTRMVPLARAEARSYTDNTEWVAPLILFRVLGDDERNNDLRLVKSRDGVEVSF